MVLITAGVTGIVTSVTMIGQSQDLGKRMLEAQQQLMRTLEAAPWRQCGCAICKAARIEVMIFRASNRNKRRGFHNLRVYHQYVKGVLRAAT